ncbi:formin-like protein 5 [Cryptomeria japonica]|uniref:formin-like protein 5 n=1 Tax=Cryptomeria japonica TaxID=3369 RepID=UPI0027DA5CC4|nr:formin-like protein 5 [Cryptomeria japonica]
MVFTTPDESQAYEVNEKARKFGKDKAKIEPSFKAFEEDPEDESLDEREAKFVRKLKKGYRGAPCHHTALRDLRSHIPTDHHRSFPAPLLLYLRSPAPCVLRRHPPPAAPQLPGRRLAWPPHRRLPPLDPASSATCAALGYWPPWLCLTWTPPSPPMPSRREIYGPARHRRPWPLLPPPMALPPPGSFVLTAAPYDATTAGPSPYRLRLQPSLPGPQPPLCPARRPAVAQLGPATQLPGLPPMPGRHFATWFRFAQPPGSST